MGWSTHYFLHFFNKNYPTLLIGRKKKFFLHNFFAKIKCYLMIYGLFRQYWTTKKIGKSIMGHPMSKVEVKLKSLSNRKMKLMVGGRYPTYFIGWTVISHVMICCRQWWLKLWFACNVLVSHNIEAKLERNKFSKE